MKGPALPECAAESTTVESGPGTDAAWPTGEVRHERDLRKPQPQGRPALGAFGEALAKKLAEKRALQKELGYPEYDPCFDDPEWHKEQQRKEMEDPRENPNMFLDPDKDPEFWHNAARKPYAKALLRCEGHKNKRRQTWLQQFARVEELNKNRAEVVDLLEDCSVELKRLVAPAMKYKVMELFLAHVAAQADSLGMGFEELMNEDDTRSTLHFLVHELQVNGARGAKDLMDEFDIRLNQVIDVEKKAVERASKLERSLAAPPDAKALRDALNMGAKCKKDGILEWDKGNYEEALISWREGCAALSKLNAPEDFRRDYAELSGLHAALLKNRSQAAIKLGYWTEAVDAAESAVRIDDQDPKAWFRKACALEGLGEIDGIEECLSRIDAIAVGRPDSERLRKDTEAKRTKIEAIRNREQADHKRMLQRGLRKGVFGTERDKLPCSQEALQLPPGPPRISSKLTSPPKIDKDSRKRLTRDGAAQLLEDLKDAYSDPGFRKQVRKLAKDVREDSNEFICYLVNVALPVQRPVLERWGFDSDEKGVSEMTRAIQDWTRGKNPDVGLRAAAEDTLRALYGPMYSLVRNGCPSGEARNGGGNARKSLECSDTESGSDK